MEINIDNNFYDLKDMMQELSNQQLGAATKISINKALIKGRKEVTAQLRQDINLKSGSIKKRIFLNKPKTNSLHNMYGEMVFSGHPISFLEFVVGSKENIKQKGIKVRKRRKLKARIAPGKTFHIKSGFIQDVKSKGVFRRKGSGRRLRTLKTVSIAVMAFRKPRINRIMNAIEKGFDKEFRSQINWRFGKLSNKYSSTPMRNSL